MNLSECVFLFWHSIVQLWNPQLDMFTLVFVKTELTIAWLQLRIHHTNMRVVLICSCSSMQVNNHITRNVKLLFLKAQLTLLVSSCVQIRDYYVIIDVCLSTGNSCGKDTLTLVTGTMTLMKFQHIPINGFIFTISSFVWFDTNKAFQVSKTTYWYHIFGESISFRVADTLPSSTGKAI